MLARQGLCREPGVKFLLQSDSNYSAAHCTETQVAMTSLGQLGSYTFFKDDQNFDPSCYIF